jgi:hypothetical protein
MGIIIAHFGFNTISEPPISKITQFYINLIDERDQETLIS